MRSALMVCKSRYYDQGLQAHKDGKKISDNPYKRSHRKSKTEWEAGFIDQEIDEHLKKNKALI